MSSSSPLVEQLHTAVAPHLASTTAAGHSPKGVAKTLKKLAKHLAKQERAAHKSVNSPKRARKALAGELLASLGSFLKPVDGVEDNVSKPVAKTIKRLAAQLDKNRRKQAKQASRAAAKTLKTETSPKAASLAAKRTTTRRAAPAKSTPVVAG